MDYMEVEGYPAALDETLKKAKLCDLLIMIIVPIMTAFKSMTGRDLVILRERCITAIDIKTNCYLKFAIADLAKLGGYRFVLLVEMDTFCLDEATKQCLLAMKDIEYRNNGGIVYGLAITGDHCRMLRYDGINCTPTHHDFLVFHMMGQDKIKWMDEASIIVDCINMSLRSNSFVINK